jgi:hypothetical protein
MTLISHAQLKAYEKLRDEVTQLVNKPRQQRMGRRGGVRVSFDEFRRLRELIWKTEGDDGKW